MPQLKKGSKAVLCLSGRLTATFAVLLCDHDCDINQGQKSFVTPEGVKGKVLLNLKDLNSVPQGKTEIWIHESTQPDRDLLDIIRQRFDSKVCTYI